VLAVSTDPAHSLGDALGVRLSARAARVPTRRGVFVTAIELDAPRAFARWISRQHDALAEIVAHGTWLDRGDIDALLALPLPGVDELVGMLEIVELAAVPSGRGKGPRYDSIIVDTAPTGHTLRLLAAPDAVAAIAGVLDALQEEHRIIRHEFGRIGRPEAADRLIELLAAQAFDTGALLRDATRTRFIWVMLPEELSLAETVDGIAALRRAHVNIAELIVNRALTTGRPCELCDRRRAGERRVVAKARRTFPRLTIRIAPALVQEPHGVGALAALDRSIVAADSVRPRTPASDRSILRNDPSGARQLSGLDPAPPETIDAFRGAQLLFFGGKGGVGKTTVSAAAALRLARQDSSRRVLLLSTDPAHSLADVFGAPVGDRATRVRGGPKNLFVRELDAAAALTTRRLGLEAALSEVSSAFGAVGSPASRLLDLAPPGIDELLALLTVTELTDERKREKQALGSNGGDKYDLIVVDTAPTGHALRLLEMPAVAREWVQLLMRVLLKYRAIVKPGQLAQEIVELSQSIRRLQILLHNREATRFVVVTRAGDLPQAETARLLDRLRRLDLSTPAIVVNAQTFSPGSCGRCRAAAAQERRAVSALARRCRRRQCVIIQAPLVAPPPKGSAMLERWAERWIA
jgi:arsenite/tail-anchored protein-transporting ATPase